MSSHHATPDDGRPSIADRVRLADDLQDQLASARLAWEAALLRSDAALAEGEVDDVRSALDDHRELLGALEERLTAVVAAAVARGAGGDAPDGDQPERPADPPPTTPDERIAAGTAAAPAASPAPTRGSASVGAAWRGASALLGAAVAVLVAAGFLVGDLAFDADGVAAGSATVGERDVRTRIASQQVAALDERVDLGSELRRRWRDLPRFSGDLPPISVTGQSAPRLAGVRIGDAIPAPDDADRDATSAAATPRTSSPATPEAGVETPGLSVDRTAPDEPSRVPLADPLTGPNTTPDAAPGADLRSVLPDPSGEVDEPLDTPSLLPPTSDPTSGLG